MKKLIIQIPCYNEEATLPIAYAALPKAVAGYDVIETLIVDDGSTDRTVKIARQLGATYILKLPHRGLAQTFMSGIRYAISKGAHTIVNFDADNQYCADDIATITAPIIKGTTGVVIGERPLTMISQISASKLKLHLIGNRILRHLTKTAVTDATSGFRAIRHDVVGMIDIRSSYTYTIEMLLQLAHAGAAMTFVPIGVTSEQLRPSRLFKNNAEYLLKSSSTVVRTIMRRAIRTKPACEESLAVLDSTNNQ